MSRGKRVHDLAVGAAAGTATGLLGGLFGAARVAVGPLLSFGGAMVGAFIGVWMLGRLDPDRPRLITPTVAAARVVVAGPMVVLGGPAVAIARFQ